MNLTPASMFFLRSGRHASRSFCSDSCSWPTGLISATVPSDERTTGDEKKLTPLSA